MIPNKEGSVKRGKNIIAETAGTWSELNETGIEYERRVRTGRCKFMK